MNEKKDGKTLRLFVYGTLRKGGLAAHFLEKFPLVTSGFVLSGFALFDGGYPYAVPAAESNSVTGDIFEIPESRLSQLDEYEGPEYRRVFLENQQLLIYVKANKRTEGLTKVEGGDWLSYRKRKNSAR